jgi:hypothetical protein
LGVLTREHRVRLLNSSVSGCLIETNWRPQVGAIASIRVVIEGREFVDDVQIVRCQPIAGAGATFHVGAQFLWTQSVAQTISSESPPSLMTIAGDALACVLRVLPENYYFGLD